MKTGILTFHRAHNYGAVLQCYALQETLKRMGHDVHVIDYRQPWVEEFYKVFSMRMFRSAGGFSDKMAYLKKNLKKFLLAPFRSRNFSMFRINYLDVSMPCDKEIPHDFDCYIIGSDQLWSLHCLGGEGDDIFYGKFRRKAGTRLIGYAVSADRKSVEEISADLPLIVSGFDALSMREQETADYVSSVSGHPCGRCVDPTLLTDCSLWAPLIDDRWKNRKYVLVYEVRWKKEDKGLLLKKAAKVAKALGDDYEVIDLSRMNRSVNDFVSLFRYASYVVTTSFHGCVFSVLFERPFNALPLWDGYDSRYMELLSSLGLSERIIDKDHDIVPEQIDYAAVRKPLEELRSSSISYLEKWIGK